MKLKYYFLFVAISSLACSDKKFEIVNVDSHQESTLSNSLSLVDSIVLHTENRPIHSIDKIILEDKIYIFNRFDDRKIQIYNLNGDFVQEVSLPFDNKGIIYDFLIDTPNAKIEVLAVDGIYDFDLKDFHFINKRILNLSAVRFFKDDSHYYFICAGDVYLTVTDLNLTNSFSYFDKLPAHGKYPYNSFPQIKNHQYLFTNFNNTLYKLGNGMVEKGITFVFNGEELNDETLWVTPDFKKSEFFNKEIVERFLFSVENYIYLTFTKIGKPQACIIKASNGNTAMYDVQKVENNVTNEAGFPYIIGTYKNKYFVSQNLAETNNTIIYILNPK